MTTCECCKREVPSDQVDVVQTSPATWSCPAGWDEICFECLERIRRQNEDDR